MGRGTPGYLRRPRNFYFANQFASEGCLANSRWLFSLLGVNERPEPTELIIHGSYWCGREDLNLHPLQDYHLKVALLPIPPRPLVFTGTSYMVSVFRIKLNTSLLAS